jgi:hypothetical protein
MMQRSHTLLLSLSAALVTLAIGSSVASAQYYQQRQYARPHSQPAVLYPRGLYAGVGVAATRVLRQDGGAELLEHGGGLTLYAGLRVNRSLALELGWMGSLHNPVAVSTAFGEDIDYLVLNGFTADAKLYLGASNPNMEPYLQAGLGAYLLDSEYFGTQSTGTGFQAGGGFDFRIGSRLLLGLRGLYRGMAMGPPQANYNDTFVSAITVEGNLNLRF